MAAPGEKPYRVYRGGRTKGKVPLARRDRESRRAVRSDGRGSGRIVERKPGRRRLWLGWTWRRWTLVVILGMIALFAIWGSRVSLGLERRERRQQAPAEERAAGAHTGHRSPPLQPDDDPVARDRPRDRQGGRR
jgi:hypothetical protein